jgi:hypothetical protein
MGVKHSLTLSEEHRCRVFKVLRKILGLKEYVDGSVRRIFKIFADYQI